MNKIITKIIELARRGTCIIGIEYADEAGVETIRNLRIGDMSIREVPYGKAVTSALFTSDAGTELVRAVDHNTDELVRVFRVDRILSLTVDGTTITA